MRLLVIVYLLGMYCAFIFIHLFVRCNNVVANHWVTSDGSKTIYETAHVDFVVFPRRRWEGHKCEQNQIEDIDIYIYIL